MIIRIYVEDIPWQYEFYFWVLKTIFYKWLQQVNEIVFLPQENKIRIYKLPCKHFKFIMSCCSSVTGRNFLKLSPFAFICKKL